jgi:hypothetical protein
MTAARHLRRLAGAAIAASSPHRAALSRGAGAHRAPLAATAAERAATAGASPAPRIASTLLQQSRSASQSSSVPQTQRGVTAPSAMSAMQGKPLRMYMVSPDVLVDPYRPNRAWPSLRSLATRRGWKQLWRVVTRPMHELHALSMCTKMIKSGANGKSQAFTKEGFLDTTKEVYAEVNELIARGDHAKLRRLCSGSAASHVKREDKARSVISHQSPYDRVRVVNAVP